MGRQATERMKTRGRATLRFLALTVAGSIVVPFGLFIYVAAMERRAAFRQADERLEFTLNIIQEHALKVLETVERAIAEVDQITEHWSDSAIRMQEARLRERLEHIDKSLPHVQAMAVVSKEGRPLVASIATPASGINLSEREYFKELSQRDAGTYVDRVLPAGLAAQPYFNVVRRRTAVAGAFEGVIVVSLLPSYFSEFYARVAKANGDGAAMALVRSDGVILARHPQTGDTTMAVPPGGLLMKAIAVQPDGGFYEGASAVDGVERRMAYRRLPGYGLFVQASIPTATVEAGWWSTLWNHIVFGVPATLLLIALSAVALARTRALYAAMDAQERAEGALRQAQKMEAIGQLTGGIAHDFNNLLMVMMGGADRLRRDLTDPKHVRTLDMITQAAKRGENLIRHLLTFSRRQSTNPTLLDVSHFLAQVEEVLRGTLPGNIRLNFEPAASPCIVRVDAGELELAVLNLAVNARDAMSNGGALTLSAVPVRLNAARDDEGLAGDFIALRVRDTGEGIPDDVLPKVFEPFFTTKAAGRGTGLGLSQVYGFAKQASGTVRIETTPGRGTTVTLLLPRAAEQELAQAQPAPAAATARILLVEDSSEVAQVTNDYLERLGHAVEVVPSAQDALALLRAKSDAKTGAKPGFDLVLSDIVMPGEMDGLDLARRVHTEFANLPIVLVTGYSASADAARREGFEVLRKPYTVDRLAQAIDRHLSLPPRAAAG